MDAVVSPTNKNRCLAFNKYDISLAINGPMPRERDGSEGEDG
jgi:hypothetical protein